MVVGVFITYMVALKTNRLHKKSFIYCVIHVIYSELFFMGMDVSSNYSIISALNSS